MNKEKLIIFEGKKIRKILHNKEWYFSVIDVIFALTDSSDSKDWIEKRMRGIAVRQDLTAEWKNRGIDENREYAILTNEISQATFGIPIKEHKKIKNLDPKFINQNLRDHMTDLELIFSMLGERVATEITQERDSKGFMECQNSAKEGGEVAGNARKDAEKKLGRSIISKGNYLEIPRLKDKRIIKEVTE